MPRTRNTVIKHYALRWAASVGRDAYYIASVNNELRIMHSKIDDFRVALHSHDLTYVMSDDARLYQAGYDSERRIARLAAGIPDAVCEKLWNEWVATQLSPSLRPQFEWKAAMALKVKRTAIA